MATHAKRTAKTASSALVEEAERLGLDPLSADQAVLAAEVSRRWQMENAEALASSNAWVERNGLPLEHLRMF